MLLRIVGTFRGRAPDAELREEMEAHLAMHVAENLRRGMNPDAARRDALVSAGGLTQAVELVRERRGLPGLQATGADLRYATRALRSNPAFTTVAVLTLALGVGANTAIFSVVNGVVLRPLPYAEPDRLVSVVSTMPGGPVDVSGPDFMDWRRQSRSFAALAASYSGGETVLTGSGEPERLSTARITANALDLLGLPPVLGRDFAEGEDEPSAPRVAMLGERVWQRRFGGDSSVIGRTLVLDGFPTTVVGIMPDDVRWPEAADVWMTTRFTERDLAQTSRGARWITVLARLAPGATLAGARAEMDAISARLAQLDPGHNEGVGARVRSLQEMLVGDLQKPLFVILGAVGFVLLIACANVASLTLGRVAARDAELAVRAALGASRGRLARQILTESLFLALLGGACGVLLAMAGMRALLAIAPAGLLRLDDVRLDAPVLAFTFGLTVLSGTLFGLVPALQGAATGLHDRLRSAGRGAHGTHGSGRSRRLLVVVEVALAVVLLAGAGLLLRSFSELRAVDPGFRPAQVTTFALSLPSTRYAEPEQQRQFAGALLAAMRKVPGVTDAALSFLLPLSGGGFGFTFEVAGRAPSSGPDEPRAQARVASADYFTTMGIPLLRGRVFDDRDRPGAPPALVISRAVAQRYFPGEDPIGKVLTTGWGSDGSRFGGEVVGIVGDVRQHALEGPMTAHMYMSVEQWPLDEFDVVVRGGASRESIVAAARAALRQLDPEIPLGRVRGLEEIVDASLGPRRFYMTLLGAFAAVALALAFVGVYGVIAYGVRMRRREIGVRLALGASGSQVVGMVVADGLRLAVVGTAIGLVAAFMLTKLLTSLLFQVGTRDPVTFVVAAAALVGAAALACVMPARGASRLDPVETIRAE
jgi:putative ABC transport system permease protein